ncbi:MAG: Hsp20/alpha crystallin family protein [Acutalibacteraceae bacterium]|jgi:HSP20 family protein
MAGLVPFNRRRGELARTGFNDFYNMLDDFFTDGWGPRRNLACDSFKIDVQEDDKGYTIEAELPGVKKDEISINLNDGRLLISVVRDENVEEEKKNYVHKERRYCSMQRSILLGDADTEQIKAKLENGELTISVPKKEKADTSIDIKID